MPAQGEVLVPIGRIEYPSVRGGLFAARPDGGPGAKPSRSRYRVLRRDAVAETTLVDVEIFTGAPHGAAVPWHRLRAALALPCWLAPQAWRLP